MCTKIQSHKSSTMYLYKIQSHKSSTMYLYKKTITQIPKDLSAQKYNHMNSKKDSLNRNTILWDLFVVQRLSTRKSFFWWHDPTAELMNTTFEFNTSTQWISFWNLAPKCCKYTPELGVYLQHFCDSKMLLRGWWKTTILSTICHQLGAGLFWNFSQTSDPPSPPPFWEPLV